MARIRLNNEYRNKIANRIKVHLQQEDTQEKRRYDSLKADQVKLNDDAWKMAEQNSKLTKTNTQLSNKCNIDNSNT